MVSVPVPDTGANRTTQTYVCMGWKNVITIVVENHKIPQTTAMQIPVSVPKATEGSDLCLECPTHVSTLAIESTINTVHEGRRTVPFVFNTTGFSVKLRNGIFLRRTLAFDEQVLPEPLELKHTPIGTIIQPCAGDKTSRASSLGSLLKLGDYFDLNGPLIKLLLQYLHFIALPGESLGNTNTTESKIIIKPNTKPVYIPDYRLPHSKRQVVDEQVKHMLDNILIQHSQPTFLFPKRTEASELSSILRNSIK